MSRYWKTAEYSQLSAEELRYKAEESMRKAESKGRSMEPVTIEGRAITVSWWGKAWCENLEKYADFASRLERGKRYVRTGTVIDLQIRAGRIQARVQGRRKAPYKVEIHISPLKEEDCQRIMQIRLKIWKHCSAVNSHRVCRSCLPVKAASSQVQEKSAFNAAALTGRLCASMLRQYCME